MRAAEGTVSLDMNRKVVLVEARSLNHAYLLASRRLEPGRISHGGSVYPAVHCQGEGANEWVPLRKLRDQAESARLREIMARGEPPPAPGRGQ